MSSSLVGRVLNQRYELTRLIDSGGMATVYLATDQQLSRAVAVKVLHSHLAQNRKIVERFREEARTAARISHTNVVSVFDQGIDEETTLPYLVMEFVDGQTLRTVLNHHERFEPRIAIAYLAAIVSGLAAAHKLGLVHRDMKPENVLVSRNGVVKVADFGLMRPADQHTATQSVLGTVAYISPELVLGKLADKRTDIYAVGIILLEMLTGKQPFTGESSVQVAYKHAHERVPDPGILRPELPEALRDLVLHCTEPNPDDRPASAVELSQQIADLRAAAASMAERPEMPQDDSESVTEQPTAVLPTAEPPYSEDPVVDEVLPETQVLQSTVRQHAGATAVLSQREPMTGVAPQHQPSGHVSPLYPMKLTSAQRRAARRPKIQLRRSEPWKATIGWSLFVAGIGVLGYAGFLLALSLFGF